MKEFIGSMYKLLPEGKAGSFSIERKTATTAEAKALKMSAAYSFSNRGYYDFEPGTYTRLLQGGTFSDVVMSDTPMEIRTNADFVHAAHGHVLIGGLGLGIILLMIQDKPEVTSITVVEKYQEVLDLVAPHLPLHNKVKIIKGDVIDWVPEPGIKYDTIYMDIWNNICADNYKDMKWLHKKFRKFLNKDNPKKWMSSWEYEYCKRHALSDR